MFKEFNKNTIRRTLEVLIAIGIVIMFGIWMRSSPPPAPKVTEDDVRNYLANQDAKSMGRQFRNYMADRPSERQLTIDFPEVDVKDTVLWDWTYHAILDDEHRVSYWEESRKNPDTMSATLIYTTYNPTYATTANGFGTTSGTAGSAPGNSVIYPMAGYTCGSLPIMYTMAQDTRGPISKIGGAP